MSSSEWHARYGIWPISTFVRLNSHVLEEIREAKAGPIDAVPSPFPTLNRMAMGAGGRQGLAHGWQVILGGASNRGKTTLALNLIVEALRTGENVLLVGLENDIEDTSSRLAAIASGVRLASITRGKQFELEEDRQAVRVLLELEGSVFVNREPVFQLKDIEQSIETFHRDEGCRTVVLDHLQLADTGNDRQIFDRVTEISHVLRNLAFRDRLLAIGVSQLNRPASGDRTKCPTIHSLLGGSPLENDANLVLLIDHCSKHFKFAESRRRASTQLIVGKNRHGPTGSIPIGFDYETSRVCEILPPEEDEWP